jgi:hypothetical protein
MRKTIKPLLTLISFLLIASPLAACGLGSTTPSGTANDPLTVEPNGNATVTPFQPATLTPTPQTITLWISPTLPEVLRDSILSIEQLDGRSIEIVNDPDLARIRVEPEAEVNLSSWVYALVAPFPTIPDGLTFDLLQAQWSDDTSGSILVSSADAESLAAILGSPGDQALTRVDDSSIVDRAWEKTDTLGLVAFDELEPRWKVLQVDGISPLSKDFIPDTYPLIVRYGLSGDPAWVAALEPMVEWPSSNRDPERMTVVVMTGVTALARGTAWLMDVSGETYPGRDIGHWLRDADFAHISHEVSFTYECPIPDPYDPSMRFCSAPRHIALLEDVGVDIVELTGNHNLDYGAQSYRNTLDMYRERGWEYYGGGENYADASQPVLIEHNGNRIALVGCNAAGPPYALATSTTPGAMPCTTGQSLAETTRLRDEGYLVIFTYQWTEAYMSYPLPQQTAGFHLPIDAGAVIVQGSQAHQPQGFEFYKDGFIHHGPGNLFFDQMWSLETRQEFVDRHVFYDGRHISTELLTAVLEEFGRPRPMTTSERATFLDAIFSVSSW